MDIIGPYFWHRLTKSLSVVWGDRPRMYRLVLERVSPCRPPGWGKLDGGDPPPLNRGGKPPRPGRTGGPA